MSEFPPDWTRTTFGNVLKQRKEAGFTSEELLAVTSSAGIVKRDSLERRDTSNEDKSKYLLVEEGDIAYNTMRMWQGVSGVSRFRGIVSPAYTICTPTEGLDKDFAGYLLKDPEMISIFRQRSQGLVSDTWNLKYESFAQIPCTLPPLPEQKKIAEILSGIDNQTELLQKGIQAKQNLRAALLSETITEDAPMSKLDSVASRVSGHTPSKSHPEYWNGGIPWVSLTDTSNLDNRYISHTAKHISEEGIKNSSAVLHPPGLVILSRDARVGCSAITTRSMAVSQHFIGWICSEKLLNKYLYYLLQKWKPRFEAIAMGSTIPTIGVPFFRDLEIPIPPMQTQERVAMALESVDSEISALSNKVAMLRVLKSGVSSDLLSGRKRVSV